MGWIFLGERRSISPRAFSSWAAIWGCLSLSEDVDTMTDVYEPFLIQCGFLARTPRGRVATEHAYRHLGKPIPPSSQDNLF